MLHERTRPLQLIWLVVLTSAVGCAGVATQPSTWQMPLATSAQADPGTPAWWKKNKSKAEFVPGEGFRVAGVEGYFDQEGRPINTKVAKVVKHEKSHGILNDLGVSESVTGIKQQMGMGPDEQLARTAFAEGEELFRKEQFGEAAKQFKECISRWPDSQLEQDAMFYYAESLFFDKQYSKAVDRYGELLKKYPNSPHLDKTIRRQFDIARYWEQHHNYSPSWVTTPNLFDSTRPWFDTLGNSIKTYESIRLNDPTGPLAAASIMATANSYFLRGRYSDADYHYQLLREEYPQSEHQYEAHILGLQCKLRKYQGPDYDGKPLDEAKKIVKQLKQQFRGNLTAEEQERLSVVEAQINQELAARDFKIAKYYDGIKYYGSAKFYYAKIARDYPGTPIAEESTERYIALGGKPEHPESKVEWFLNIFPENAERKAIAQIPMVDSSSDIRVADRPQAEGGSSDGKPMFR